MHASGPFDVKLTPQPPGPHPQDGAVGRLALDKQFHGDLEATSRGQMLAASSAVFKDSAGICGNGERDGNAAWQTRNIRVAAQRIDESCGTPSLAIMVVPDSGTDELAGLAGTMEIVIAAGGKHSYEFEYTIDS